MPPNSFQGISLLNSESPIHEPSEFWKFDRFPAPLRELPSRAEFPLQLCQHPWVYKIGDNDIRMGIMRTKISNYAFHTADTGFPTMTGILIVVHCKFQKQQINLTFTEYASLDNRKAPVVEQVEDIPALMNSKSV